MYLFNLATSIIRWVINILRNWTTKIRSGDEFSDDITIQRGVPQDAALSPILYSIYVNDTPISPLHQTQLVLFAYDTAYWSTGRTVKSAIRNLQKITNKFIR